jgi:putative FmdB family regulatory protein
LRAPKRFSGSEPLTTIRAVPIYEFSCCSCDHRFEELVGSEVGTDADAPRCPECGSGETERLPSSFAINRRMTPAQKRRLEDKRGIDRGGAKERFKRQRARDRASRGDR